MSVDGSGNFSGTTDFKGAGYSGGIVNGVVSGTYSNDGTGDNGTITGELVSDPSPFAGTYSGTYSGDSSGTWTITISSDGYVTGTINTDAGNVPSRRCWLKWQAYCRQ